MSGRLFEPVIFSALGTGGFGIDADVNYRKWYEDAECVAIGPSSDCSHVKLASSANPDQFYLCGVGSPFIGQRSGGAPLILKQPIIIKPYQIMTVSYTLDLLFYSHVPPVVPLIRAPGRYTKANSVGNVITAVLLGRKKMRVQCSNNSGAGGLLRVQFSVTSLGGGYIKRFFVPPTAGSEAFVVDFSGEDMPGGAEYVNVSMYDAAVDTTAQTAWSGVVETWD